MESLVLDMPIAEDNLLMFTHLSTLINALISTSRIDVFHNSDLIGNGPNKVGKE